MKGAIPMELKYKKFLLNELEHGFSGSSLFVNYWFEKAKQYGQQFNVVDLHLINDLKYCGSTEDRELVVMGRYYLYDAVDNVAYWFYTLEDAIMFGNSYMSSNDRSIDVGACDREYLESFFEDRRRKQFNGLYWLTAEDFLDIDSILTMPPLIICMEENKTFFSEEEAAEWLVEIGKAATLKNAMRQLTKCLSGETQRCYGYSWRRE